MFYSTNFFTRPVRPNSSNYEKDNMIQIALPGFSKEDINIQVEGRNLIISADIPTNEETSFRHSFVKTYTLGNNVDVDNIDAKMENGVLTLDMSCAVKTKQITIN